MNKIIIYNIEDTDDFFEFCKLSSYFFEIVGYSDSQNFKKDLLPVSVKNTFIPVNELCSHQFDFIVINGEQPVLNELISFLRPQAIDSSMLKLKFDFIQLLKFNADMWEYSSLNTRFSFSITEADLFPVLYDHLLSAGSATDYFFQDLWAARKIHQYHPLMHYDVGSRLDGFIAYLLAAGQPTSMLDIRPLPYTIPGLSFVQTDATNMATISDNSIFSLSALSSVEHFGLGRYGDPIDPEACFKAMSAFERILAPNGHLYFGVPVGSENRCCFNAHRIFTPQTVIESFPRLQLLEFAYIHNNAVISFSYEEWYNKSATITEQIGRMAYGLFEFTKLL